MMEIEVIESTKDKLKFKIKGETHTFCNILRRELWKDKSTRLAGYKIEKSLEHEPVFILETNSRDPKKVLLDAAGRLEKEFKEIEQKLIKVIK